MSTITTDQPQHAVDSRVNEKSGDPRCRHHCLSICRAPSAASFTEHEQASPASANFSAVRWTKRGLTQNFNSHCRTFLFSGLSELHDGLLPPWHEKKIADA